MLRRVDIRRFIAQGQGQKYIYCVPGKIVQARDIPKEVDIALRYMSISIDSIAEVFAFSKVKHGASIDPFKYIVPYPSNRPIRLPPVQIPAFMSRGSNDSMHLILEC